MRAFLNLIAILLIAAAAYGIGKLHHKMRFSEKPTVANPDLKFMEWSKSNWYMNEGGEEFRDDKGRITQARGCRNASGFITTGNTRILNPVSPDAPPVTAPETKAAPNANATEEPK